MDEIKVGKVIDLALEDLLRPLVGRTITVTIEGVDYVGEIQEFSGIHTAPVKIKEIKK